MKLTCLTLVILPICVFADGGLPSQPYIYIEGTAEVEKPADMASLRFSVVAHNIEQGAANKEVQAAATKIFSLLNTSKIPEKDVIASDLKSEREYEEDEKLPRGRSKLIGYTATRPFMVKVRDLGVFPKLVDDLLAIGSLDFSGIDAGLSNEKELETQVWDKALANAREKAENTVRTAGMKIDSTFAISPVVFPAIESTILGSSAPVLSLNRDLVEKGGFSQYRLPPISVKQTIHVIYLISPAK